LIIIEGWNGVEMVTYGTLITRIERICKDLYLRLSVASASSVCYPSPSI